MIAGHIYYFLEDVFPHQPGGFKLLKTPLFLKQLCDPMTDDPAYRPLPEDRPGGFDWGNNDEQNEQNDDDHPHRD